MLYYYIEIFKFDAIKLSKFISLFFHRKHKPTGGQPDKPSNQTSTNGSSTSSPSTCSSGTKETKRSETEGDFVYVEKVIESVFLSKST